MNVGVNFFGPKKKLYYDFEGTLELLKQAGINSAEICVSFTGHVGPPDGLDIEFSAQDLAEVTGGIWTVDNADEKVNIVRKNGLEIVSAHLFGDNSSPEGMLSILPSVVEFGKKHQIQCFVISLMKNYEQMIPFVDVMNTYTEALEKEGIMLAYHNHEVEFDHNKGVTALDYIMEHCPLLKLELDVGWVKFAGYDPLELMDKYQDRLIIVHLKDITEDACNENRDTCFTAIGEGSIPLKDILNKSKDCALIEHGIIIDQDDSLTDIIEDFKIGVQHIRED